MQLPLRDSAGFCGRPKREDCLISALLSGRRGEWRDVGENVAARAMQPEPEPASMETGMGGQGERCLQVIPVSFVVSLL